MILQGMIKGIEMMGAKFIKTDDDFIYLEIPKGSEIDDDKKLNKAKYAFKKSYGLGLKIKRTLKK